MGFQELDKEVAEAEKRLNALKRQLADTDRWWEGNPDITPHFFNGNDEWLALRTSLDNRIGGSEIGTVAGHNHYQSPFALYCEKIGLEEPRDLSKSEAVRQGHDFEHKVAERFEKETGKRVHEESAIFINAKAPHLKASIDRKVFGEDSGLECKTAKDIVMRRFPQGDFPQSYYDQCATYLKVTGLKRWYLAMIVFGTDFKVFLMTTVKAEEERFNLLRQKIANEEELTAEEQTDWDKNYSYLEACYYISPDELDGCETLAANFISRVEAYKNGNLNAWPNEEIDGSDSTTNAVKTAYKVKEASVVTFDEADGEEGKTENGEAYTEYKRSDIVALCEKRQEVDEMISQLEAEKDALDNQMCNVMKEKETFMLPGWKVTFKMGTQREMCSSQKVKDYFKAMNKEVPKDMITLTNAKRGVRFWKLSDKPKKGKKS